MIREFLHSGNTVTIGEEELTLSDFKLLFPDYKLPNGAIGQLYKQNESRRVFYADGRHEDIEPFWPEGDNYIINQYTFRCQIDATKLNNNPRVVPTAELLLQMSVKDRKEKIKSGPYSKLGKQDFLAAVRKHRTNLLKACDWTILPDSPLSEEKKAEWLEYRQKLRDLPTSKRGAFDIVFPSEPQ